MFKLSFEFELCLARKCSYLNVIYFWYRVVMCDWLGRRGLGLPYLNLYWTSYWIQ